MLLLMMIKSFKHRGLKRYYERGDVGQINPQIRIKTQDILSVLDIASSLDDLNLPQWRLHRLKGELKDFWSLRVQANWRIIFRFKNGNVYDVDLIDYH